jgi:Family of unknown function (DUF6459)
MTSPSSPHRGQSSPVVTARFPRRPSVGHAIQGTLALDLRGGRPGIPETPELEPPGPARLPHVADAEVRAWAARLAQAVVEAVGLQRPVSQLVRWTAPNVYRDLERRVLLVRRASDGARSVRPQVRSIHVCRPTPTCAEASVHVRHGARSRALAMRMERRGDRWLCTVLEFG